MAQHQNSLSTEINARESQIQFCFFGLQQHSFKKQPKNQLSVPVARPLVRHRPASFLCFGFGSTHCCRVRLGRLQLSVCCRAPSILLSQQSPAAGIKTLRERASCSWEWAKATACSLVYCAKEIFKQAMLTRTDFGSKDSLKQRSGTLVC